jgi:hypothetical protein
MGRERREKGPVSVEHFAQRGAELLEKEARLKAAVAYCRANKCKAVAGLKKAAAEGITCVSYTPLLVPPSTRNPTPLDQASNTLNPTL